MVVQTVIQAGCKRWRQRGGVKRWRESGGTNRGASAGQSGSAKAVAQTVPRAVAQEEVAQAVSRAVARETPAISGSDIRGSLQTTQDRSTLWKRVAAAGNNTLSISRKAGREGRGGDQGHRWGQGKQWG